MQIRSFLESGFLFSERRPSFQTEEIWIGWGKPERTQECLPGRLSIFAPDFFLEMEKPWFSFPNFQKLTCTELIKILNEWIKNHSDKDYEPFRWGSLKSIPTWKGPDFQSFKRTFFDLKKEIELGHLKKAVPIVFDIASWNLSLLHRAIHLSQLLSNTEGLPVYTYGIWEEDEGILGATPEILFQQWQEKVGQWKIKTMALAGTRLAGSKSPPLLENPKELEEHRIVIDGICSAFQTWMAGRFGNPSLSLQKSLKLGQTQELTLPTLSHLCTPIELTYDQEESSFLEILKALHPTPALGTFPKSGGFEWLKAYEQKNDFALKRHRFGAPFAFCIPKNSWVCAEERTTVVVSIRNLQWMKGEAFIAAGCGIISSSQLSHEWEEFLGKISSVKKIFGIPPSSNPECHSG